MSTDKTHNPCYVRYNACSMQGLYSYEIVKGVEPGAIIAEVKHEFDANRIVQCLNAMEGVKNPEMFMRIIKGIKVEQMNIEDVGKVIEQNNELIDVLKKVLHYIDSNRPFKGIIKLQIKSALNI